MTGPVADAGRAPAPAAPGPVLPPDSKSKRRRRRLRRRILFATVLALLVPLLTLWVLTRSWYIISRAEPILSRMMGGDVRIERAVFRRDGRFDFLGLTLRIPGVEGAAGEVIRVERAEVTVDPRELRFGRIVPSLIVFDDVVLRLVEAPEDGAYLIGRLRPLWSTAKTDGIRLPPRVDLRRATIEFGDLRDDAFDLRASRIVTGTLEAPSVDATAMTFRLVDAEPMAAAGRTGLSLDGTWDLASGRVEAALRGIALDQALETACPRLVRAWWRKLELEGRLEGARLRAHQGQAFEISVDLREAGITMPIETDGFWTWYRAGEAVRAEGRPRMRVESGRLVLTPTSVRLERLKGSFSARDADGGVAAIPYIVDLALTDIPPPDWSRRAEWLEDVLATVPFEVTFIADDLVVHAEPDGEPPAVVVPAALVPPLRRFRLREWSLSAVVRAERAPPSTADGRREPGPVTASGTALIRRAAGAYEGFPYELDDVGATIEFDQDRIVIHELSGRGSGDSTVRISGTIGAAGHAGSVDLRITAGSLPLDARLRAALAPRERRIFDMLLDEGAVRRLAAAGLPGAPTAGADDAGPGGFRTGGTVDIDLALRHAAGEARPLRLEGHVAFGAVGLAWSTAPYPITALGGALSWNEEGIRILGPGGDDPSIAIRTAVGGAGSLRGHIEFPAPDSDDAATLRIEVEVRDDPVTDLLLAALPPGPGEAPLPEGAWPGEARSALARLLDELGFEGVLDYSATVARRASGDLDVVAQVRVRDATADAGSLIGRLLGAEGIPGGAATGRIEAIDARLEIAGETLRIASFEGSFLGGTIRGHGTLDPRDGGFEMHLDLHGVAVSSTLVAMLPDDGRAAIEGIWQRLDPTGRLDGHVLATRRGAEPIDVVISIVPRTIEITTRTGLVRLAHAGGHVSAGREGVTLEALALDVSAAGISGGRLQLDGHVEPAARAAELRGAWTDALTDSPLFEEVLAWALPPEERAELLRWRPRGVLDCAFHLRHRGATEYQVTLQPRAMTLTVGDVPIAFEVERGDATGGLVVTPGRIRVRDLRGRTEAGRVHVSGEVRFGAVVDIDLDVSAAGRLTGPGLLALLPAPLRAALTGMEFSEQRASRLEQGHLRLVRSTDEGGHPDWSWSMRGAMHLDGARFRAGVQFDDVHASLPFDVAHRRGSTPRLRIQPQVTRAGVLGQTLEDMTFDLALSADGTALEVTGIDGRMGGGRVAGTAQIGLAPGDTRTVSLGLSGARLRPWRGGNADRAAPPAGSGQLYGSIEIRDIAGSPAARTGRTLVRVTGGEVATLPVGAQLFQILQVSLPTSSVDFAEIDAFIAGDRLIVERALLESTVGGAAFQQFIGAGEVDLVSGALDLDFRARGAVAGLRDLLGGIGDRLAAIRVTGTLDDPLVQMAPALRASRRLPGRVLAPPLRPGGDGPAPSPGPAPLAPSIYQAASSRSRSRRSTVPLRSRSAAQ